MGVTSIEPIAAASPLIAAVLVGLPVAGKVIVAGIALRGSESKDRAAIVKAVSELFRWWRR
ncbi:MULTISPECIES: hypothetical protein [unclassified Micromonospora]|uniref:hypothetical protein n=1 Tax=unclassified Micromonospora TaxID=2617518 RepID=UPI00331E6F52